MKRARFILVLTTLIFIVITFFVFNDVFASTKSLSQICNIKGNQLDFDKNGAKNCEFKKFNKTTGELRNAYIKIKSLATYSLKVQNLSNKDIYFSSDYTTEVSTNNFFTQPIQNQIPFGTAQDIKAFGGENNYQNKDSAVFPITNYSDIDAEIIDNNIDLEKILSSGDSESLIIPITIKTTGQFSPTNVRIEKNVRIESEIELVYNYISQDISISLQTSGNLLDYSKPNFILSVYNADTEDTNGIIKINIPKNPNFKISPLEDKTWKMTESDDLIVIQTSNSLEQGRHQIPLNVLINDSTKNISFEASVITSFIDGNLSNNKIKTQFDPRQPRVKQIQMIKPLINSKIIVLDPRALLPKDYLTGLKITNSDSSITVGENENSWFDLTNIDYEIDVSKNIILKAQNNFSGQSGFEFEYVNSDNLVEKSKFSLLFDQNGQDVITLDDTQSIGLPRTGGITNNVSYFMILFFITLLSLKISFLNSNEA